MKSAVRNRTKTLVALVSSFLVASITASHAVDELRILAFGDSNTWGWEAVASGFPTGRLGDDERWPGVLATRLGRDATVVVDGLVGRRTDLDADPVGAVPGEALNGSRAITAAIARSQRLDLVIIMLGTNDLQSGVNRSPAAIADATMRLAKQVTGASGLLFSNYPAPRVLVVAPPPFGDTSRTPLAGLFATGEPASRKLGEAISEAGRRNGVPVYDAAQAVSITDGADGIHLSRAAHKALGEALAAEVRRVLNR